MSDSRCHISFDNNPEGVYFAGQLVSGTAGLTTTNPFKVRDSPLQIIGDIMIDGDGSNGVDSENHTGDHMQKPRQNNEGIYILIKGSAEVKWTKQGRYYNTYYEAKDIYFESKTYLIGSAGGGSSEYPPGVHIYTFQLQLPETIPSSLLAKHGKIRYFVQLVIDRPWKLDFEYVKGFTVIAPFNLNYCETYKLPLELSATKDSHCCMCCAYRVPPLKVNCRIPHHAYVPGQRVPYSIAVENETSKDIRMSKVSLERITRFTSDSPPKEKVKEEKLLQNLLGPIPKQETKLFEGSFLLPSLPSSSLRTCRIIDIRYEIRVRVCLPWYRDDLILNVPFIIGTYPLMETFNLAGSPDQQGSFTYEKPFTPGNPEYMQVEKASLLPKYPVFHHSSNN